MILSFRPIMNWPEGWFRGDGGGKTSLFTSSYQIQREAYQMMRDSVRQANARKDGAP